MKREDVIMTHWFEYSVAGVHVLNAKRQVNLMKEVTPLYKSDFNYYNEEREVFKHNTAYGVLAIYSINAAVESIVALLSNELSIKSKKFHERINILKKKNIITCHVEVEKLVYLRKKRNTITHWEKNKIELLGSADYLPIMFKNVTPRNEFHKLISLFTAEDLREYIKYLDHFIENVKENVVREKILELEYTLKNIQSGMIYWE